MRTFELGLWTSGQSMPCEAACFLQEAKANKQMLQASIKGSVQRCTDATMTQGTTVSSVTAIKGGRKMLACISVGLNQCWWKNRKYIFTGNCWLQILTIALYKASRKHAIKCTSLRHSLATYKKSAGPDLIHYFFFLRTGNLLQLLLQTTDNNGH